MEEAGPSSSRVSELELELEWQYSCQLEEELGDASENKRLHAEIRRLSLKKSCRAFGGPFSYLFDYAVGVGSHV